MQMFEGQFGRWSYSVGFQLCFGFIAEPFCCPGWFVNNADGNFLALFSETLTNSIFHCFHSGTTGVRWSHHHFHRISIFMYFPHHTQFYDTDRRNFRIRNII